MNSSRTRGRKSAANQSKLSSEGNEDPDAEVLGLEEQLEEAEGGIRIGDIYVPPPPPPALTYDCTGPRLVISYIENIDFKSYAGEKTLGPFHKSFSAIVGPNGSGKSNIIDSMLFVFGYRAQKIRSKNISVLIHNSSKFPDVQKCTVTVKFEKIIDDGDDFTIVPGTQFKVSRVAFKNNKSIYLIDDREVTFKDVGRLLRSQGIDLDHNRFLILQGEVEQIAMMKAKAQTEHDSGMLEYLEDIIGTHRFKKPIEMLATQVEEFSEQRTEMLNRVKMVEKEKDDLEGPRNEAVQFLKTENKITSFKNKFLQVQQYRAEVTLVKSVEHYDQAKKELDLVEEQMAKIKDDLNERHKELKSKEKLVAKCIKTAESKKEEFTNLERKDMEFRASLKHAKSKIKSSKAQLVTEEEKLIELRDLPDKVEQANAKLLREKEELEQKLAVEEKKLAEVVLTLKEETKVLQEEKDVHQSKLIGLRDKVDATKKRLDVLKVELNVYLSAEQKEKEKLDNFTRNFEKVSKDIEDKEKNITLIGRTLPETQQKLQEVRNELEQVINREVTLAEKIRSDRMKVEEAKSNQQSTRSRGRLYETLMMLKDKRIIPGILGRLGDLGGIDEKYDVAISSASGMLDHYIIDTVDTGQACIQYLKDNNLGIGHFLALDKIQNLRQRAQEQIETPENVPRLFDLIKVNDDRVKVAFYFALRDTLVAQDMNQATRIAYGRTRYRVVTLKGELIDKEGTMTGGGGRPRRGMMGKTAVVGQAGHDMDTSFDVSALQVDLEAYQREIQELRMRRRDLEESIRNIERDLKIMEQNQQKDTRELQVLNTQRIELEKQINAQQERVAAAQPDQNKVKQLQKPIDAAQKEFDAASEAAGEVSAEVERVQDLIKEISNEKIGSSKKAVSSLKKKVKSVQEEITKSTVAAKTSERNMIKCQEKIESLKEDITQYEATIAKSAGELKQLEEDAKRVMEEHKVAQEERQAIEEEFSGLSNDLGEFKKKSKTLQENHIDAKTELEKYVGEVTTQKQLIKSIQDKLSKLTLHVVDAIDDDPDKSVCLTELPKLTEEELEELNLHDLKYEIEVAEQMLKDKNCNMAAIENFRRKEKQYLEKVDELEKITEVRDSKRQHYVQLKKERLNEFMNGFSLITNKLKEVYQMLTQGGDAELELVDSLDPFSDGITFSVRPPKKSWKMISNLSGGEKTLSSLALVMALHYYRPTPLYVMDEIDAALDFRNVSIVGHYIKERTKNAQFIVISLRNNMYELADRLIGIYKTYDCTKSITVDPNEIVKEVEKDQQIPVDRVRVQDNDVEVAMQPEVQEDRVEAVMEPEVQKDCGKDTDVEVAMEPEVQKDCGKDTDVEETIEPEVQKDCGKDTDVEETMEPEVQKDCGKDTDVEETMEPEVEKDCIEESDLEGPNNNSQEAMEIDATDDDLF